MKKCIHCQKELIGRQIKYCSQCFKLVDKEKRRIRASKRYYEKGRTMYDCVCIGCGRVFKGTRKITKYCSHDCQYMSTAGRGKHERIEYESGHGKGYCLLHRRIVEETLKRKLSFNEVVHHLDENPKNNELQNIIILERKNHSSLHRILVEEYCIYVKQNKHSDSEWTLYKVKFTLDYLNKKCIDYITLT